MILTFGLLPPNLPRKTSKNTQEKDSKGSNMLKVGKAICHKCGDSAKFNCGGKWYCGYRNKMGEFNLEGYCKKEERKDTGANNNT